MIAKLYGKVDSLEESFVILNVSGVGYALLCSAQTRSALPSIGEETVLFVEPLIRSETITLFGFFTREEKEAFKTLLTVQGVGGKICLNILSVVPPSTLQHCLEKQDHLPLTQADGVGPKLALRIIRELKGKYFATSDMATSPNISQRNGSDTPVLQQDLISILTRLGYRKVEITDAFLKAQPDLAPNASLDAVVQACLKQLGTL